MGEYVPAPHSENDFVILPLAFLVSIVEIWATYGPLNSPKLSGFAGRHPSKCEAHYRSEKLIIFITNFQFEQAFV